METIQCGTRTIDAYIPEIEVSSGWRHWLILDLHDETVRISETPDYETGMPQRVWNGAAIRWALPCCPDDDEIREALADEDGLGGELLWFVDHYATEYDHNANLRRVALDDDADEAILEHRDAVDVAIASSIRSRAPWQAGDWYAGLGDEATLTALGIDIDDEITDELVEREIASAEMSDAYLVASDVRDTLREIQARVRADREERAEDECPDGWQLVSSDLLAPLDPAKTHPEGTTHWHRTERRAVEARKILGVRWAYRVE